MSNIKITAVINAHREGVLALPSIASMRACQKNAIDSGYDVQIISVLDKPDYVTKDLFERMCKDSSIIETSFGDLGMARNAAIELASGDFVAFLDADDLWGEDWLTLAARSAQQRDDPVIWHPELSLYFGASEHLFIHVDMEEEDFNHAGLVVDNYWTALSFSTRKIYLDNPYPKTDISNGIGFEDWTWNMATINNGIIHKIVRGTGHAIRKKEESLSRSTLSADAISNPGDYLRSFLTNRR